MTLHRPRGPDHDTRCAIEWVIVHGENLVYYSGQIIWPL
jgi:hypothetical protein